MYSIVVASPKRDLRIPFSGPAAMQAFYRQPTGNLFSTIICTNCSTAGHTSKHCTKPITSYGVILFRCKDWNQAQILQAEKASLTGLESVAKSIEYLLIQRRDSIGFIELIRGKYKVNDYEYISKNIAGMTAIEREKIRAMNFDELWEMLWGPSKDGFHAYKHEKEQGRIKLEALRTGTPSLDTLIKEAPPPYDTPEWGFPKGRKNLNESEYSCAMRETWEETNIMEKDIVHIRNMEPITENFTGSNGIPYCHKYFIGYTFHGVGEDNVLSVVNTNEHIQREVGDIRWCSVEDALKLIRPENPEKRDVLLRVDSLLKVYCPLQLGPITRTVVPQG
jgi:8-oxo-dGTP pyrophosphatase MutT (NUDIX family)